MTSRCASSSLAPVSDEEVSDADASATELTAKKRPLSKWAVPSTKKLTLESAWKVPRVRDVVVRHPVIEAPCAPPESGLLVVDLFCGIGGFSSGARMGGHAVVLGVDWDDKLLAIHALNHQACAHASLALGPETEAALVAQIRAVVPEGRKWHLHGSPPCTKLSPLKQVRRSEVHQYDKDESDGLSLVTWFLAFAQRSGATTWSMEQVNVPAVRGVLSMLKNMTPDTSYIAPCDFSKYGIGQTRVRCIAGSACLIDRLQKKLERAPVIREIFNPPPEEAFYCMASTGSYMDTDFNVINPDGTITNKFVSGRVSSYSTLDQVAHTCCAANAHRWCREDYTKIRNLTPKEMGMLQSFPEDYDYGPVVRVAVTGVGNAVPPRFAYKLLS